MATLTHPTLTPAEFTALMWRAGWRASMELIDGEVVVIPPTGGDASFAQTELVHRLRAWQEATGRRGQPLTDVFVRIGDSFLAPDVVWWREGREPEIGPGAIDTLPDLVVEVLSPATRENDLGPKRRQYVAAGVPELWLVDPAERTVLVVRGDGERRLGEAAELRSPQLPGFGLPVSALLA
jgi:Uma2 family endonuclease